MSDDNASSPAATAEAPAVHPAIGGKSLASLERPRYKSWRKKYRKMHAVYNTTYEENRSLFKEEQRLEAIAKRLREEIDGLLELCLDLNQTPSLPPELRFDLSLPRAPSRVSAGEPLVQPGITPEEANAQIMDYNLAVRQGRAAPLDLAEVRAQVDTQLAAQGLEPLDSLEKGASRPTPKPSDFNHVEGNLSYMPFDHEMDYLARLDARLSAQAGIPADPRHVVEEGKHYAELTPRELERKTEFENPQSQHNWLKTHTKALAGQDGEGGAGDDTESLASHDLPTAKAPGKRKSGVGAGKGSLAKQVGDRALERAREGSAAAFSNDEDELASDAGLGIAGGMGSGKKRARDPDGTFRLKGGAKGASSAPKGKRKRSGEDWLAPGAGGKKARVDVGGDDGLPGGGTPAGSGSGVIGMG